MSDFIGIDTSNYTTSSAVFNDNTLQIIQKKQLLPVKSGECGLRQSDAVFHHVCQLSNTVKDIIGEADEIKAVGVSSRPRNIDGSYMPCFLAGKMAAEIISYTANADIFYTSHQIGHIAAALYSCNKLSLINEKFIAFHVSGGTTDILLCTPDNDEIISAENIGGSSDLKAGQLIDRVGVMLGLDFPCGKELEKLAVQSQKKFKIKTTVNDMHCCLSGIENQCIKLFESGESKCDVANFCISSVYEAIRKLTDCVIKKYGKLHLIYSGGVMSNKMIADRISAEFGGFFASAEYSCDNAAGIAVITNEKYKRKYKLC